MTHLFSKLRGAVGAVLKGAGNLLNGGADEAPVVTVSRRSVGSRAAAVRVVAVAGALVLGAALVTGFTACDDGTDDGGGGGNTWYVQVKNEASDTTITGIKIESTGSSHYGTVVTVDKTDLNIATGSTSEKCEVTGTPGEGGKMGFKITVTYTRNGNTVSPYTNLYDGEDNKGKTAVLTLADSQYGGPTISDKVEWN